MEGATTEHGHSEEHGGHTIVPIKVYAITYVCLMILMALTVAVYTVELGAANNIIAMLIAVVKATLVVLFFMQVKYSSRLTWVWAALGFIWLTFLFGTMADYFTRTWIQTKGF